MLILGTQHVLNEPFECFQSYLIVYDYHSCKDRTNHERIHDVFPPSNTHRLSSYLKASLFIVCTIVIADISIALDNANGYPPMEASTRGLRLLEGGGGGGDLSPDRSSQLIALKPKCLRTLQRSRQLRLVLRETLARVIEMTMSSHR